VVTIFPAMVAGPVSDGIVRRAVDAGLVRIGVHDLRAFSDDRHRTVDDAPFGGGPGMVMKAEPFFRTRDAMMPGGPGPRDAVVRGRAVPDALLSGDHGRIRRWRRKEALRATRQRRPDLLRPARLSPEDQVLLRELEDEQTSANVADVALSKD